MSEHYITVQSSKNNLSAILHSAQPQSEKMDIAVLILVGGPQYRIGSHRQFVKLSRALASNGITNLRLDFSGMGDSEGQLRPFYANSQAIKLAIDTLIEQQPAIRKVVIWGLCDAASAALLYCYQQADSRVAGLVLLNPWVRQQQSHAKVMLKHYYWQRLSSKAFWQKLLGGGLNPQQSFKDLLQTLKKSRRAKMSAKTPTDKPVTKPQTTPDNYVQHMLAGWHNFNGKTLLITSGNDLTAKEFLQLCETDSNWAVCLQHAQHEHIESANHTFASSEWRALVEQQSYLFIKDL
jgi:exosortase A-associated hydrolase 1